MSRDYQQQLDRENLVARYIEAGYDDKVAEELADLDEWARDDADIAERDEFEKEDAVWRAH